MKVVLSALYATEVRPWMRDNGLGPRDILWVRSPSDLRGYSFKSEDEVYVLPSYFELPEDVRTEIGQQLALAAHVHSPQIYRVT